MCSAFIEEKTIKKPGVALINFNLSTRNVVFIGGSGDLDFGRMQGVWVSAPQAAASTRPHLQVF